MKDGSFELFNTKNNLILKYPLLKNITFKTMICSTDVQCLKIIVDQKHSWLRHLTFVHLNFRSLNQLITQYMVTGIPSLSMSGNIYESCLVWKQSINSFILYMPVRSSCILYVVHLDVCGLF